MASMGKAPPLLRSRPPPDPPLYTFHPLLFESLCLTEPPEPPDSPDVKASVFPHPGLLFLYVSSGGSFALSGSTGLVLVWEFPKCSVSLPSHGGWFLDLSFRNHGLSSPSKGLFSLPPCPPPTGAPSVFWPPEPPDPPDGVFHTANLGFFDFSSSPSPQALTQTSTLKPPSVVGTKIDDGDGSPLSASCIHLAYGLLYPMLYRFPSGNIDWPSSCYGVPLYCGVSPFFYGSLAPRPPPQAATKISSSKSPSRLATRTYSVCNSHVFVDDTLFAFGLLFPVLYRSFPCQLLSPVLYRSYLSQSVHGPCLWILINSQVDFCSLLSGYPSSFGWDAILVVWVTLDLLFLVLLGDVLMDLESFGYNYVPIRGFYGSMRQLLSAVCSPSIVFNMVCGAASVCFSSWLLLKEKISMIYDMVNMVMAGIVFQYSSGLEQSLIPMLPLVWSELEAQTWLALHLCFSQLLLISAVNAATVITWITQDATSQLAYKIVLRFVWVLCGLYHLYPLFVICLMLLALCGLLYSSAYGE